MTGSRSYSELILLPTFEERFRYLKLNGQVGSETFGSARFLNQSFYQSDRWKRTRRDVIIRDNGCDLAFDGRDIRQRIVIHHINPISIEDVEFDRHCLYDLENLICTTDMTHKAIHYGDEGLLIPDLVERMPNDTCPWK